MYFLDPYDSRGPMDSAEAYQMGLRPGRCNGCKFEELVWQLRGRVLVTVNMEDGWTDVYEVQEVPTFKEVIEIHDELYIFRHGFMSINHSDECWDWQPPPCDACNDTGECPECDGSSQEPCSECQGRGWEYCRHCPGTEPTCQCRGSGKIDCHICGGERTVDCMDCEGSGQCECSR